MMRNVDVECDKDSNEDMNADDDVEVSPCVPSAVEALIQWNFNDTQWASSLHQRSIACPSQ